MAEEHNFAQILTMMKGFLGEIESKIDQRGRFLFPAQFVKIMGSSKQLIMKKGIERCIEIYTETTWAKRCAWIKSLNLEQVDVRKLQRKFYAGAASLELDVNNRIVIPSGLKDWAELSKEVILSGMDERIELWSAEKYLQASDMDAEEYEQLAARLMGGGYNSPDRAPDL